MNRTLAAALLATVPVSPAAFAAGGADRSSLIRPIKKPVT